MTEVEVEPNPCFADSRRLVGPNRFFAETAAILEPLGERRFDVAAHAEWQRLVGMVTGHLGWQVSTLSGSPLAHVHASGVFLVVAAPEEALFTATEINEWAWEQASGVFLARASGEIERDDAGKPFDQLHPFDTAGAQVAFAAKAMQEVNAANPNRHALFQASAQHDVPLFWDDESLSLGIGRWSKTYPLADLPHPTSVPWEQLSPSSQVPIALVTGSNGKTTTVRLIAAMLRESGKHVGYCCTEGVFIDGAHVESGDYSGPAGARVVLRHARVEGAVLEMARGGIARRGLAVKSAQVAVVTNISADHFGEYGIHCLDDLADAKLTVARALGVKGTLVLNADDPTLAPRAAQQRCEVALFALDDGQPALQAARATGAMTCGVDRDGQLVLTQHGVPHALGDIRGMPLTVNGAAGYNIANLAAAVLAAAALAVGVDAIRRVVNRFGADGADNPGRLQRFRFNGAEVLVDYAHNPAGLDGLLRVAAALKGPGGRIGLLLGQAGNREDDAIDALCKTAAAFTPDRIVVKELHKFLRGRPEGEVPQLIFSALCSHEMEPTRIEVVLDEASAAQTLIDWAQEGDVIVLPIHQTDVREVLARRLATLGSSQSAGRASGSTTL